MTLWLLSLWIVKFETCDTLSSLLRTGFGNWVRLRLMINLIPWRIITVTVMCRALDTYHVKFIKYLKTLKHLNFNTLEAIWLLNLFLYKYMYGKLGQQLVGYVAAKSLPVVSDSVRSYGQQPTRLSVSWDSPGKNMEWVAILL